MPRDLCPHCHQQLPLAYKKFLRRNMLKPLAVLAGSDKPLTTQELGLAFYDKAPLVIEITKHFAGLRIFGLIEEAEPRKYRVTVKGMRFIDGFQAVPEWLWTVHNAVVPAPESEDAAPFKHIWQIEPRDFSEPRSHLDEAVQQFQLV
jgi:hypothetical protein